MGIIDKMMAQQRYEDCEEMVLQAQDRLRRLASAVRCYHCGDHIGDKRWVVVQHEGSQEVEHSSCYYARTMEEEAAQEAAKAKREREEAESQTGVLAFPSILKPGTSYRGRKVHCLNAEIYGQPTVSEGAGDTDIECDDDGAGPLSYYEGHAGDIAEIVRRHGRAS
jgi:hypothetical protein